MNKRPLFLFVAFVCLFAGAQRGYAARRNRAGGYKPKVVLNVNMGNIKYFYKKKRDIRCETPEAAGCTHIKMYCGASFIPYADGIRGLTVNLGFEDFTVDVASEYPKGSCEFNLVLKHELTHVAFARAVVERYSAELAAALLAEAEAVKTPISRRDAQKLFDITNEYCIEMNRIQQEQHDLMDSKGNNSYQWEQCRGK